MNVSIVIPAYNSGAVLGRAVRSALGQTVSPFEVIVVDDGSKDNTEEVARSFGERVVYLRQLNSGPSRARNTGIWQARGEVVGFVDADDELMPDMVERLVGALEQFPDAAAASGAHVLRRGGVEIRQPAEGQHSTGVVDRFFDVFRRHTLVCTGSVLVRTEVLRAFRGFREDIRFGEDLDLWCRIAGRHPWVFVDSVVVAYNQSPETSATLKTKEADKPLDFLLSEAQMREAIRTEHWGDYRCFRRDMLLRQARAALAQGSSRTAAALMARIPPAPRSIGWILSEALLRAPGSTASLGLAVVAQGRRALRYLKARGTRVSRAGHCP